MNDRFVLDSFAVLSLLEEEAGADSFAAALAMEPGATLVTGDPEFARLEPMGLSLCRLPR
ncbi:MAG: hypothetical protein M0Z41_11180 [Peptococcaceae bacterium]|jgi:predicted nucleic acid-binding protein|nr:hypothetical protein [Peptococcaceae bacterium]